VTTAIPGDADQVSEAPFFFPVSVPKLVTLSVVTFGIYQLFWFYANWALERDRRRFEEISPFWRMFFSLFYCYSMFRLVRDAARARGFPAAYSAGLLAAAYITLTYVCVKLPGPWFFICLAGSLPLVPVQRAANAVNAAERPLAATNARFTALDWLVVVLGGLCVALAVLGTFVPA